MSWILDGTKLKNDNDLKHENQQISDKEVDDLIANDGYWESVQEIIDSYEGIGDWYSGMHKEINRWYIDQVDKNEAELWKKIHAIIND